MIVGRKIAIKVTTHDSGNYYTKIGTMFNLTPFTNDGMNGVQYISNGSNFYIEPTMIQESNNLPCVPIVTHIEFKNTVWTTSTTSVTYSGFGYVWTYSYAYMSPNGYPDGLDSWSGQT